MDALAVRGEERRDTCEKLRGAGYKALIDQIVAEHKRLYGDEPKQAVSA